MNEMYTLLTKGGSVAGKFGEINLKTILESAGFKKGVTYDEQKGVIGYCLSLILSSNYNTLNAKDDIIVIFV